METPKEKTDQALFAIHSAIAGVENVHRHDPFYFALNLPWLLEMQARLDRLIETATKENLRATSSPLLTSTLWAGNV